MSKNVLLISVDMVKERSQVHLNVDDKLILPEIKAAQDTKLESALGSALFKRLQAGVEANNLTADEQALMDDYLTDALVWFTVAALPITGSFQMYSKGTVQKSSDNSNLPSFNDLLKLSQTYESRGEYYRERLIRYLSKNAVKYPLYTRCAEGDDIEPTRTSYRSQCYLGD